MNSITSIVDNDDFGADNQSADYILFCEYLEKHCGITLGNNKSYLVNSRLKPIKEAHRLDSLADIIKAIESGGGNILKAKVIDAMTTNETSWFRDKSPFEILQSEIFPSLQDTGRKVKVWSAACSSGHEPYSISIAFEEFLEQNPGQFNHGLEILATDISRKSLDVARAAEYDELSMARGLSDDRRRKYFTETANGMLLANKIKQRVRFQEFNLLNDYSTLGRFDAIFCRNVLIYFSNDNKTRILHKMAEVLQPNGYLFLGASEPIVNYSDSFEMVSGNKIVYYRRK